MNPWHDLKIGDKAPEIINAIIEIPQGSRAKYELDKESGLIKLDRIIYSSMYYPANYGFIPRTYCDDKDPLDILVISQAKIVPMCLVTAKVIGAMQMIDGGEEDDKIIAVAEGDMSVAHYNDLTELPKHMMSEMRTFFEDYKKLEHKSVSVEGFKNKDEALQMVQKAIDLYKETF